MNNKETMEPSSGLQYPDWKRVKIPPDVESLAKAVVDASFSVHTELGPGLLESAYEACLSRELELRGVKHQRQLPVHTAQVITYLRIKKFPLGLLINFNEVLIKNGIHRILNVPRSQKELA